MTNPNLAALEVEVSKLRPADQQPHEQRFAMADGIAIVHFLFPEANMLWPQHSHEYPHVSLISHGSVKVLADGEDLGTFRAPAAIEIRAGVKHLFVILESWTAIACIHRVDRTGEIDIREEHQLR